MWAWERSDVFPIAQTAQMTQSQKPGHSCRGALSSAAAKRVINLLGNAQNAQKVNFYSATQIAQKINARATKRHVALQHNL